MVQPDSPQLRKSLYLGMYVEVFQFHVSKRVQTCLSAGSTIRLAHTGK